MSIADAIAFCGLMVAIISVAGILLEAYNRRLRHREKTLELEVRLAEAAGRSREAGVPQMEERLRVLERIATDRKSGLAEEIEALRVEKDLVQ
ncbi:MAG TPA: hypothetical protein VFS87_09585 [Qipengyuania sp.]|nr:hypothetical protein [Qipengyuania sp.]